MNWQNNMNKENSAIIIFTKNPVEGHVKTRLIPEWGTEGALHLYKDILKKTIESVKQSEIDHIYIYCTPDLENPYLQFCSRQYEIDLVLQRGSNLGERMNNAFVEILNQYSHAIIVGCDCPELNSQDINIANEKLKNEFDIVIGPAEDGGYYLIGMHEPHPEVFENINWGCDSVLDDTRNHISSNDLKSFELEQKWDLDMPDDVHRYFRSRSST